MEQNIIYNGLKTPDGTIIESRHRHDYQTYTDANGKTYMIDGGLDYSRCSMNGDEQHIIITLNDEHEKVREYLKWGTYGKDGNESLHYIKLKNMDTNHIKACIETVKTMYPQIRTAMLNELSYREKG